MSLGTAGLREHAQGAVAPRRGRAPRTGQRRRPRRAHQGVVGAALLVAVAARRAGIARRQPSSRCFGGAQAHGVQRPVRWPSAMACSAAERLVLVQAALGQHHVGAGLQRQHGGARVAPAVGTAFIISASVMTTPS
jgi:hypothetical protein